MHADKSRRRPFAARLSRACARISGGGVRDRFREPAFATAEDPLAHPPIGTGAKGVAGCSGGLIHGEVRDV